jgi:phage terminase large subunit
MPTLTLDVTTVFEDIFRAFELGHRYVVVEGGTRSSKTFSICQALMLYGGRHAVDVDVCRESMPVLRRGAYRLFQRISREQGLYSASRHNKTENIIRLGRSRYSFYGVDEETKLRGPERDIAWINEANSISAEVFRQIRRRTRRFLVLDYNPSHGSSHWIDADVIGSGREIVIRSTYLDNPFLTEEQVQDIEADVPRYREADGTVVVDWELTYDGDGVLIDGNPEEWAVNGLGKRARGGLIILPYWDFIDRMPGRLDDECFGLDFGYTAPSALIRLGFLDVEGEAEHLYADQYLYKSRLTTEQLGAEMRQRGVPPFGEGRDSGRRVPIYADSAEPDRIRKLRNMGFNVLPAKKDVSSGIDTVKGFRLRITRRSVNVVDEIERYKWATDGDGNALENPAPGDDHSIDAIRYGAHTHRGKHTESADHRTP